MSQVATQIESDAKVRTRMENLLGWDEAELNTCEFEAGLDWLVAMFGQADGPARIDSLRQKLASSPGFWTWWKNQWRRMDALLSPNLRPQLMDEEWMLGYRNEFAQVTYYSLRAWRMYYVRRHADEMARLRPDDDTMRRILKAA